MQSPHLKTVRHFTRLRLESELYQLTLVGGPRYLPRSVNRAAFATLGQLFPKGNRNRRFVSW